MECLNNVPMVTAVFSAYPALFGINRVAKLNMLVFLVVKWVFNSFHNILHIP